MNYSSYLDFVRRAAPCGLLSVLLILALLCVGPPGADAQGFVNAKYAGEFLGFGVGARSAALGGTGTGLSDDVTAGYFNPASLSLVSYPQISVLHESRFAGQINYDYAGAVMPFGPDQSVALSAVRLGLDGIKDSRKALIDLNGNGVLDGDDRIDNSKIKLGGASDWAVYGSYSRSLTPELSVGGSVKFLYKSVLEYSAWGLGVDLSAMYRPDSNLMVGAILNDATKSLLTWTTGAQEFIVPSLRLGASYRYAINDQHSLRPCLDGVFRFEGRSQATLVDIGFASLDLMGGLEYGFRDRFFVRAGYTELKQITVGAGLKLPKLNIDYAFTQQSGDLDGLGATHRISLMLTLEELRFERGR